MYGDVDLQTFRDKILGDKLANSLSLAKEYTKEDIPHEWLLADPNAQEVQQSLFG